MFRKFIIIIGNFYKTLKLREWIEILIIPLFLSVVSKYFINNIQQNKLSMVVNDFNNSVITIITLLAAFGIASVTLLFTSSSNNIEKAKEFMTERKNINNIPINYYQLILIRNYYTLLIQFLVILLSIIIKFISIKVNSTYMILIEAFFVYHIIIVQLIVIMSMYHLMWKDKK